LFFRVEDLGCFFEDLGRSFRVEDLGRSFRVEDLGRSFRVEDLGRSFRVQDLGRSQGAYVPSLPKILELMYSAVVLCTDFPSTATRLRFRVQGSGFRVQGSGFRVQELGVRGWRLGFIQGGVTTLSYHA